MNITVDLIPSLPKIAYNGGKPTMIVLHETANQFSTIDNEVSFVKRNWQNAFYHYIVGSEKIVQVADANYIGWGAGPAANPFAIHIELVRNNGIGFDKAYQNYINLAVELANIFSIPIRLNKGINGVVTHRWVSDNLGGTNHVDPDDWLAVNGKSIAQLEIDLTKGVEKEMTITAEQVHFHYMTIFGVPPSAQEKAAYTGRDYYAATEEMKRWAYDHGNYYALYRENKEKEIALLKAEIDKLKAAAEYVPVTDPLFKKKVS